MQNGLRSGAFDRDDRLSITPSPEDFHEKTHRPRAGDDRRIRLRSQPHSLGQVRERDDTLPFINGGAFGKSTGSF
jgi:hypothetical protein